MSRRKGAQAERDVVLWLRLNGFSGAERRGVGFESSDIIGVDGVSFEVKNQAQMQLASWVDQMVEQMERESAPVGVVIHKRKGVVDVGGWYATLPVSVFARLLAEAGYGDRSGAFAGALAEAGVGGHSE